MKNLSYYSWRKKDRLVWIPVMLFLIFTFACGPSKEEMEAQHQAQIQEGLPKVSITIDDCNCEEYTATYYIADSCDYIGSLSHATTDVLAHSGQCRRCEKRKIQLMDSLIKVNLKYFFSIEKK